MTTDSGNDLEEKGNSRRYCTLSAATVRYLERLSEKGTHGTSVPRVMASLIEEGIRHAIKEGFITLENAGAEPT